VTPLRARQSPGTSIRITLSEMPYVGHPTDSTLIMAILCNLKVRARLRPSPALLMSNVADWAVRSTGQCNTFCSLSAGVSKPKVFRGR